MYKVVISKIEKVTSTKEEYEKLSETGNPRDNGAMWGYVPKNVEEEVIVTVLSQTIEEIDVPAVIKAINKI